jgi:hypothetical protein
MTASYLQSRVNGRDRIITINGECIPSGVEGLDFLIAKNAHGETRLFTVIDGVASLVAYKTYTGQIFAPGNKPAPQRAIDLLK